MEVVLKNVNYKDKLININYSFKKASITSVLGKNNKLLGLLLINKIGNYGGEIYVNGKNDYNLYDFFKKVGYVSSNPDKYFVCESVKDELAFVLKQYKYEEGKIEKKIMDALKMVGLSSNIINKRIVDLSSGEKVRVSLASVLVINPEMLIIDDIICYLDSNGKKVLLDLLLKLKNKYNKTIVLLSNNMDFIYSLGNDYILLNDGKLIKRGEVRGLVYDDEMFDKYGVERPKVLEFIKLLSLRGKKIGKVRSIADIVKEVMVDNG